MTTPDPTLTPSCKRWLWFTRHLWGRWKLYEAKIETFKGRQGLELRQRRECLLCGFTEDRYVN